MPTMNTTTTRPTAGAVRLAEVLVKNEDGLYPDRLLTLDVQRGSVVTVYAMQGGMHGVRIASPK
jgi:hypothetical protein